MTIIPNLLDPSVPGDIIQKTGQTRKLNIGGINGVYPIYRIRLDALYYNDKNDRIASWLSKYKADNNIEDLDISDREPYNAIIEKLVSDSNPNAMEKTKKNIALIGQQESGVILKDGRIIDGNRRFTCLRKLSAENAHNSKYFEAIILECDYKNDNKTIKSLELGIQHGIDSKIDYNPIDRMVGVYNDITRDKLFTVTEYAQLTNERENDVKSLLDLSNLMVEYLEFIGEPNKFYIARENDIDGPLHEIMRILKKAKSDERREQYKQICFNILLNKPEGDMTRFIRQINSDIAGKDHEDTFIDEQMEHVLNTAVKVAELDSKAVDAREKISQIRENSGIKGGIKASIDKAVEKTRRVELKNKPLELLEKSIGVLDDVDLNVVRALTSEQQKELENKIDDLDDKLKAIRESIGE